MLPQVNCFIPYGDHADALQTIASLKQSPGILRLFLLVEQGAAAPTDLPCEILSVDALWSSSSIKAIADCADADYALICTKPVPVRMGFYGLERMVQIADDTRASMVYADFYEEKGTTLAPHPVIDYQKGSLRDDFDFGPLLCVASFALKKAAAAIGEEVRYAGLYELRLKLSQHALPLHISEYLYTVEEEKDRRRSGEKIFDYVDPKNRAVQIEMEQACTRHLKAIGGYLAPAQLLPVRFEQADFDVEVSVIIPVRNRVRTIEDAMHSVWMQETSFPFNLIVVDNHSTDGTTEMIDSFTDKRLIHLIPERTDLGIGGCWNMGVHHAACGRFAVQLDSDDLYSDPHTLQKVVDTFYAERCAMVVGTYRMTDFQLETIPPGVIDHREWSAENGRNNALRINGLGAPRAFYTPVLRQLNLPNTSYGEDYAVALRISRSYAIGRIYDVIYLCRRWEDNSDASLDIKKMNEHNLYKDKIRTWELEARIHLISEGEPTDICGK